MIDNLLIGKRIREMRKEKDITQNEFAEVLHVSFQAVSNWERGVAPPDLDNLYRIARYFGVLVDDLLRPAPGRLLLGVDGGGTKTEFVVATEEGNVLKRLVYGGSNPNDIGVKKTAALLSDGIREILTEFPSVCSVFCGISGAAAGDNRGKILDALTERYPMLRIAVETDSANLFASDDSADMAVISGTGSVVYVKRENRLTRVGGWGYLIDSGGSAYDIGLDALRTALQEEDSLKTPCRMSQLLREKLGAPTVWDAVGKIYAEGKSYIASLAEVAFLAYREGDTEAERVISRNAARLAELLNIGIRQYGARSRAVVGGGIFEHHGDIMIPCIQRSVEIELVSSGLPPVYGACRQAMRGFEADIPKTFYEKFMETYRSRI